LTTLTIPDVDDALKLLLKARAVLHGKSVEVEARDILREALGEAHTAPLRSNLYAAIRSIVEPLGGIELEIPTRRP